MKNLFGIAIAMFNALFCMGQIDMSDSSVQVITYWDKGDVQNYTFTTEKFKIKNGDTTSKETSTYDAVVTVLKAKKKSYTIEWQYKDVKTNTDLTSLRSLMNGVKGVKVIYKTDEMGIFLEVVNWKEIQKHIRKTISNFRKNTVNIPEIDKAIKQLEITYASKEAIESTSIKDVLQFHGFHGVKFQLGVSVEGELQVPNIFGNDPFDAIYKAYLDEIDEEEDTYLLYSTQEVDEEQLTNETFNFMSTFSKNLNIDPPKREDLKNLKNLIETTSMIHGTGWVVYSRQTTTVSSGDTIGIEERTMELN